MGPPISHSVRLSSSVPPFCAPPTPFLRRAVIATGLCRKRRSRRPTTSLVVAIGLRASAVPASRPPPSLLPSHRCMRRTRRPTASLVAAFPSPHSRSRRPTVSLAAAFPSPPHRLHSAFAGRPPPSPPSLLHHARLHNASDACAAPAGRPPPSLPPSLLRHAGSTAPPPPHGFSRRR
ncbi:formin-like protein 3 [Oryza sativa Japonica Group]|nr:formin-like protein 5 [Oryza sativa Japonica Group]